MGASELGDLLATVTNSSGLSVSLSSGIFFLLANSLFSTEGQSNQVLIQTQVGFLVVAQVKKKPPALHPHNNSHIKH